MMEPAQISIRRGSLFLKRGDCERHFGGLEAVILLRDQADLLILPVRHAAAGSYILKLRNSDGDRVVTAADFFRSNGIDDGENRELAAVWDESRAALRATAVFCGN